METESQRKGRKIQTEIGRAWSRNTGRDRKTKEGEKIQRQGEHVAGRQGETERQGKGRKIQTETGRACNRETGRDRKTEEREKDTDRRRQGDCVAWRQGRDRERKTQAETGERQSK